MFGARNPQTSAKLHKIGHLSLFALSVFVVYILMTECVFNVRCVTLKDICTCTLQDVRMV